MGFQAVVRFTPITRTRPILSRASVVVGVGVGSPRTGSPVRILVVAREGGSMKVTAFVLPVVLIAIGFSTTQAGLFDVNLLERLGLRRGGTTAECGPQARAAGDCEPGSRRREVVKQPCRTTLHTYQRQAARPLPPASTGCAKPIKPIAECETAAEAAASAQRTAALAIARLIFRSQTSCYARDRRGAIHRLGDGYDCSQNPEILVAFIYALNDADESVRAKAADEIGDQLGQHPDCAAPEVVAALKVALGDCDAAVRREVRQALSACRIDVVRVRDGNCARPAAKCVPARGSAGKKPRYEKPVPGESKIEPAAAVVDEPAENPAADRGLPALIKYVKTLKRPRVTPSLQKLFSVR